MIGTQVTLEESEQILLLNDIHAETAKTSVYIRLCCCFVITRKGDDKRVSYKNRPIFCSPILSAGFVVRLSLA